MKIRTITIIIFFFGGGGEVFKKYWRSELFWLVCLSLNFSAELTFTPLLTVAGFFSRLLIVPSKFYCYCYCLFCPQIVLNIVYCAPDRIDCALESVIALFCFSMGPDHFQTNFLSHLVSIAVLIFEVILTKTESETSKQTCLFSLCQHCRLNICCYFEEKNWIRDKQADLSIPTWSRPSRSTR